MASYLGIDPDSEPGLLDIARMAIAAPVLPGWQQVDTPDGYAVFRSVPGSNACAQLIFRSSHTSQYICASCHKHYLTVARSISCHMPIAFQSLMTTALS